MHILNLLLALEIVVVVIDGLLGITLATGGATEVGKAIDLLHGINTATVVANIASQQF